MLTALVALSLLTLCLVLWKSAPPAAASPAPAPPSSASAASSMASHGKGLADHGKDLKEAVSGKKCPHCGKPI